MFDRGLSILDVFRDNRWLYGFIGVITAIVGGWLIGTFGVIGALMTVGVPIAIIGLVGILAEPKFGLLLYVNLGFLLGLPRFSPVEIPIGLCLDGLVALTVVSVLVNGKRMVWSRLHHPVFYMLLIWLFYTILEFFNPEAPYPLAWFFHARYFSLNWIYVALIVLVVPISRQDIKLFLKIWFFWSFLACLWSFKQQYIGLETAELKWLNEVGAATHMLFGQLRSFSFYTDASQFGAEMAGLTLICMIWVFDARSWLKKIGYAGLAVLFFWGFAVSGTRSALFVILAGYPAYLFLRRNVTTILLSIGVAAPLFAVLMFTHIGDSNYQIYRMRTALHPGEDPSFQLRLENQRKLRAYMKDLPFGAGIGTSTDAGNRFSPNHFAARISPDSWYVQLWIETGVVGVFLYLLMLAGIICVGTYKVWQINDPWLTKIMVALLAEFIGIVVMSYSNPTLGQFPTSTILFINSILFTTCERWDTAKAVEPTRA
ncbi:O-antigen ligase family protein [Spirosoma fluminis]